MKAMGRNLLQLNSRQTKNLYSKIEVTGFCWLWKGYLNSRGYGQFRVGNRMLRAHRVVYEHLVGIQPPELVANHLCYVRNCVNPDHLEFITQRENVLYSHSPVRKNFDKTHCKRGHPLSGDNLYIRPCGSRVCRECKNTKQQEARRKKREESTA